MELNRVYLLESPDKDVNKEIGQLWSDLRLGNGRHYYLNSIFEDHNEQEDYEGNPFLDYPNLGEVYLKNKNIRILLKYSW